AAVAQQLLELDQVLRRDRTQPIAAVGVEEVDEHGLALQQVVVEPDPIPVLGAQHQVREVLTVEAVHRPQAAGPLAPRQELEHGPRRGGERHQAQQAQYLAAVQAGAQGTTFHWNIMAWSSWTTLWQWAT